MRLKKRADENLGVFMFAIKGICDGVNLKTTEPIPVKEEYEVIITFIEPVKKSESADKSAYLYVYPILKTV